MAQGERRAWREAARKDEQSARSDAEFAEQLAGSEFTDKARAQAHAALSLTYATLALLNQQRADADQRHDDLELLRLTVRNGQ